LAFPYLVYELWRFVKPALYPGERSSMSGLVVAMAGLFILGISFGYFLLAPISILFLGSYQVSAEVANTITLQSYAGMLSTLVLASGLIFELPVLAWFLAKAGILTSDWLRSNRRIAVVVNMIVAAVITPSDVGSMILMSFPLLLLYEVSISVVSRAERRRKDSPLTEY
jgi:sec-independent protein translocase protein TatC